MTFETNTTTIKVSRETLELVKTSKVEYMAKNKVSRLSDNEFLSQVFKKKGNRK